MSLPPLLRHVYNHGTEEVIRRGKKIFYSSGVQLLDVDHLIGQVRFRVRNDLYQNYYTVTVTKFLHADDLVIRCQCPYNLGEICRHEVAALFQLNDILQSGFFENTDITYDQKHTVVRMRHVNRQMMQVYTSPAVMEQAQAWAVKSKAIITTNKNETIIAEVPDGDATYKVTIRQNEERYFDTSCGCSETAFPLCVHKATLFLQILQAFGPQHFQNMQDWEEQKNKMLRQYGFSLNDDLTDKFTFVYENGKPFLRVLDPSLKKINHVAPVITRQVEETAVLTDERRLGIVLDTHVPWYPFMNVVLVSGNTDDEGKKYVSGIERIELLQYINPMRYRNEERELIPVIRKFTPEELFKYLRKNLPFGDFLDDYTQVLKELPSPDIHDQVWEYLLPKYQKLFDRYNDYPLCFLRKQGSSFSTSGLEQVEFAQRPVHPELSVRRQGDEYIVSLAWIIDSKTIAHHNVKHLNAAIIQYGHMLYCVANAAELQLVEQFMPGDNRKVSASDWPSFLSDKLMAWSRTTHVHFDDDLVEYVEKTKPLLHLYLQEREQMLILQPAFSYNGVEIKWGFFGDVIQPHEGVVKIVQRNDPAEQEFLALLRNLHSDIQQNAKDHFFYIPGNSVLANNWFFRFMDIMREWNVELFGFEGLKNLRINAHKPTTRVHVSSGMDWFDAAVEITFGEEVVTITEVKRALAQKQNFVKLGDGSIGLLPEEWLKKYSLLLKIGESKGDKLRLKKYHFSVLDELLAEVDEEAILDELEAKKERLSDIINNDFSNVAPPPQLQAQLRPYQLAGFQWLLFLKEAGWGGILADDMGLGKTVQTLTFFQHYKNDNPDAHFLVVCPTTLMYNWENEIKKFTPELTNFIHHGSKRSALRRTFEEFDITITTYGTMRSDIKMLKDVAFDYVVLDESQSIKNPQSQVAKASLLLNAKNRLALSGTPVQNNTFDLYAQMNFLNPGMLGSREFFMNEFATPIDKFREDEVKQQLRKLTYPFLLRRTKEQVAKDLPEKTEMILYCEMGGEQRRVYDSYRNAYRSQILGMIDEKGIERSQLHILQGLTKLRQICDSPAILNEEERFPNHSVKLEELTREIDENVGDHKVLIFSQFLGMLALIRKELEAKNIAYVYFDGSTTSRERENAIQEFQNNHECRVFLISLKAGGIGLNLTAADYVYIVDPWWNPAVEQQAIDRTHRIGQTKNIFAYRLICKDTIEEKMLQLQERKRALANELVSDDNALLKRLTRDDIAFLFS
ncbi:MAG: SNF2 helicase associated domain-containing protein [Taibaiella sp.]|nr:SNF2 helicase associated domain-containing protein [Taibaiella sp.]